MYGDYSNSSSFEIPSIFCYLIQLPVDNRIECQERNNGSVFECLYCPASFSYMFGDNINDYSSPGHLISLVLVVLNTIVSGLAVFTNWLIVIVFLRQRKRSPFDKMLMFLGISEGFHSVTSVIGPVSAAIWLQNWSRGVLNLYIFLYTMLSHFFLKSVGVLLTLAVTIERYLAIAYPLRSRIWFTSTKTKLVTIAIIILSILFSIPKFSSCLIQKNVKFKDFSSVGKLDYLILTGPLSKLFYQKMLGFIDMIDFTAPFPLLLLFQGLTYKHLRTISSTRKELNAQQKKEIRAAQMFLPVVVFLVIGNLVPFLTYVMFVFEIIYTEMFFLIFLLLSLSSLANLPIYYGRNKSFRNETNKVLCRWIPSLRRLLEENEVESSGTDIVSIESKKGSLDY